MNIHTHDFEGTERFEIEDRLGSGGFGVVYRAYDREKRTAVALKTLPNASAEAILRFKREFRTLADIAHPNLVSLYELVSDGEHWFFSMELIDGVDFLQYVYGGDVPPFTESPTEVIGRIAAEEAEVVPPASRARHLCDPDTQERLRHALAQLTSGLSFLHHKGLLHRDIKPANVLVTRQGRLVLLDFGLSTELRATTAPDTAMLPLVGTPEYMAPELAEGKALAAGDWYSVGTMLFEAMTGRLPYDGEGYTLLMQKATADPPRARELADCVPRELDSLCAGLLARNPGDRPSPSVIRSAVQQKSSTPITLPQPRAMHRLLPGRERHFARLDEALSTIRSGRPAVVIIRGRSGMGRTHLVQSFLEDVSKRIPDAIALYARCYERETVPFKALDALMDALALELDQLPRSESLPMIPEEIADLARLFPAFAPLAENRQLPDEAPLEIRRRAFTALRHLLRQLASKRTVVLAIDDLQWGDVDSALVLADIFKSDPPPLMLISSYRSEDADSAPFHQAFRRAIESSAAVSTLSRPTSKLSLLIRAHMQQLVLEELSFGEATAVAIEILAGVDNALELAEQIARESGGNPYLITELARYALSVDAPEVADLRLENVLHARMRRLPPEAARILATLAVAGRPLRRDVCRTAAGVENTYQSTVAVLRAAGMIRVTGMHDDEQVELSHDRVRQLVSDGLDANAVATHHDALALTLEASESSDHENIAYHFRGAGDSHRAIHHQLLAAERAEGALAFDAAARLYRTALEWVEGEVERQRLSVRLAEVLANASRGIEAARIYVEAAKGATGQQALDLQRLAAEQLLRSGHVEEGLSLLRGVFESLNLKFPESRRASLLHLIVRRLRLRIRGTEFAGEKPVVNAAQLARVDTTWSLAIGLGLIDPVRGTAFQTEHVLLALDAGEPFRAARAIALEAAYVASQGTRSKARSAKLFGQAEALALEIDRPDALALTATLRAISTVLQGEWARGEQLCADAEVAVARQKGMAWELFNARLYALISTLWRGDLNRVWARLPMLLDDAVSRGDLYAETYLRTRLTWFEQLIRHGFPEVAAAEDRQAIGRWTQSGFHTHHYHHLIAQTEIALYGGDPRLAHQLISDGWPALKHSMLLHVQIVGIEARFLRARASISAALYSSGGERMLRSATRDAKRLAREKAGWGAALATMVRGSIALARGDGEAASAWLNDAEQRLRHHGMELHRLATRYALAAIHRDRRELTLTYEKIRLRGVRDPEALVRLYLPGVKS